MKKKVIRVVACVILYCITILCLYGIAIPVVKITMKKSGVEKRLVTLEEKMKEIEKTDAVDTSKKIGNNPTGKSGVEEFLYLTFEEDGYYYICKDDNIKFYSDTSCRDNTEIKNPKFRSYYSQTVHIKNVFYYAYRLDNGGICYTTERPQYQYMKKAGKIK